MQMVPTIRIRSSRNSNNNNTRSRTMQHNPLLEYRDRLPTSMIKQPQRQLLPMAVKQWAVAPRPSRPMLGVNERSTARHLIQSTYMLPARNNKVPCVVLRWADNNPCRNSTSKSNISNKPSKGGRLGGVIEVLLQRLDLIIELLPGWADVTQRKWDGRRILPASLPTRILKWIKLCTRIEEEVRVVRRHRQGILRNLTKRQQQQKPTGSNGRLSKCNGSGKKRSPPKPGGFP